MAAHAVSVPVPSPGHEHRRPVSTYRCPEHGCIVLLDGRGMPLGPCRGCQEEAAAGILAITAARIVRLSEHRIAAV